MRIKLHPQETIKRVYLESLWVVFKQIALPTILIGIVWYFFVFYQLGSVLSKIVGLLSLAWIIVCLRGILLWRLNKYILTSERLIAIRHNGFFKKTVIETSLERILNVSYKITGISSSFGGFGDVEVQVVGLMEPIILVSVHDPAEIKDYIWQAHTSFLRQFPSGFALNSELQQKIGYTKPKQRVV